MSTTYPVSPAAIGAECLCLGLRRAARAVTRRYDEALRPADLNAGQFAMLTTIAGLGPVSVQMLADRLAMDRTTVTAALKPLQRRRLAEVTVAPNDKRSREVILTAKGRMLFVEATALWQAVQRELAEELSAAAAARLRRQLSALS